MPEPFFDNGVVQLHNVDARDLSFLADESVDCVVTSPPYWGLRDYGLLGSVWGGDPACEHEWGAWQEKHDERESTSHGKTRTTDRHYGEESRRFDGNHQKHTAGSFCTRCSAWLGTLGLEPTPELYVEHLVEIFREVWRVLKKSGVLWLNIGDSYVGPPKGNLHGQDKSGLTSTKTQEIAPAGIPKATPGLKPKDLVGVPWMVAKALQAPYYTGRIKNVADRAWLAGWLDGEGTISFVERDRGPDHTSTHDCRVFFTNSDRTPMDEFSPIVGGRVNVHDDGSRENRYGTRTVYRWQMGTHDGAQLLRELYPYLRTKRPQAALIWTLYLTLRHKNGHARTPESVVKRRQEIASLVRALNHGESVVLPDWVESPPPATEPGWWLRSDIIWAKPNPMPESVTDRPTRSHEYLFLLTKAERYYYDQEAVREPVAESTIGRGPVDFGGAKGRAYQPKPGDPNYRHGKEQWGRTYDYTESSARGRNRRSVWTIPTRPFPEAHFATFPEALVEPCILAGTSEYGNCSRCGTPWERVVEKEVISRRQRSEDEKYPLSGSLSNRFDHDSEVSRETTGWNPACTCKAPVGATPGVVLDPFAGSGTVGVVAQKLGRRAVLVELSTDYCELAKRRLGAVPLPLNNL